MVPLVFNAEKIDELSRVTYSSVLIGAVPAEKNFTLRGVCYFTFQSEVMSVRIVNATFWFFVRAPTLPQKQPNTMLLVNKLVPSNSKSGPNNFKKQVF